MFVVVVPTPKLVPSKVSAEPLVTILLAFKYVTPLTVPPLCVTVEDVVRLVKVVRPVTPKVDDNVAAPVTPKVDDSVAAPVTPNVDDKVAAPVTPKVVETVAAPVTVKAPVATARPAVRFATLTCLVVLLCTMGKTSVPARGVVLAGSAEILVFAMMYQS